jgi:translation initiation factor 1 (eIF-1/SUI1)
MPNPIQVTVENRQGKKQITKLTNLEAYLINAQQIQLPLKNMCASSVAGN